MVVASAIPPSFHSHQSSYSHSGSRSVSATSRSSSGSGSLLPSLPVISAGSSGSSGGPTNLSRADQDGLLGFLDIDLELPYLGPSGLHSMYPKFKEIARVTDHKLIEGLHNNAKWRSYLEENGLHNWQPTLMDFIHIFVAKSQFYDNWKPAFREAKQFPILIDWLDQRPGCLTNKEMLGDDKDTYSLSDMNKWMARGGPPTGKKVDVKERRGEKSAEKKSKKKKKEISPESDLGRKKSKKGKNKGSE